MPFLRRSGRQFQVYYGKQRIHAFLDLEALRQSLAEGCPELRDQVSEAEWVRLEAELREAAGGTDAVERLQKQCRRALEEIRRFPADDPDRLRSVGYDLKQLLQAGAELFARLKPNHKLGDLFGAEESEALLDQAVEAFGRGQARLGAELFQRARELDPVDPDLDNTEGICWFEQGELERARELVEKARTLARHQLPERRRCFAWSELEVRPYLRATYNLGLVLQRQGEAEQAVALWRECLRLCPGDGVGARFLLAPTLQRLGHLEEALRVYREHAGEGPTVPDLHYDMATALVQGEQLGEAVLRLVEGLAINRFIPPLLLGTAAQPPAQPAALGDPASPQWAWEYCRQSKDLWIPRPLKILQRVFEDDQTQRQLKALERAEDELRKAGPDQKPLMIHRYFTVKKRLTGGRWRHELSARMLQS